MEALMKECRKCRKAKNTGCFPACSAASDGLGSYCQKCVTDCQRNPDRTGFCPTKKCINCKAEKPSTEFSLCRCSKDGLQKRCRDCVYEYNSQRRQHNREKTSRWRATRTREERASKSLRDKCYEYGIRPEDYTRMMETQNGVCAICNKPCKSGRRLAIDHCHSTGAVRGLLCAACNTILGLASDSPDVLRQAAVYLEATGG